MDNLEKIRSLLSDDLTAVLLTGEASRRYASGVDVDEGMCLISAEKAWYFTDGRYLETAQNQLQERMEVLRVTGSHTYSMRISEVLESCGIDKVGIEEENLTYGAYSRLASSLPASLIPCQRKLDALRHSKAAWEQTLMRQAQALADGVFSEMLSVIREGMTEKELEAELIYRLYRAGAEDLSFPPIVVSGPNGSLPHGKAGSRRLQAGDFITMDFGIIKNGYCSDMTRTVALGHATEKMRKVYDTVLRAQLAGIAATRAGVSGAQVDAAAREVIAAAGYGAFFCHSYGHSLGLEIHEAPNCSPANHLPLPAGAVISAEPGIYLPGELGVRIEDVVIVTESGCENITGSPKELIIL